MRGMSFLFPCFTEVRQVILGVADKARLLVLGQVIYSPSSCWELQAILLVERAVDSPDADI